MATRRIRQSIIGGAVTAATALAVLSAAPSASAQVTGISGGTALMHVGSTYTLTASDFGAAAGTQVSFWVGASSSSLTLLGSSPVNSGVATISWTPTAAGNATIVASDDGTSTNGATIGVSVTAVPAGGMGSGSAAKIPIIGGLLSSLLAAFGLV